MIHDSSNDFFAEMKVPADKLWKLFCVPGIFYQLLLIYTNLFFSYVLNIEL